MSKDTDLIAEAQKVAPILAAAAVVAEADKITQRIKTWTELLKGAKENSKPPNGFYEQRIESDLALHRRLIEIASLLKAEGG